MTDNNLPYIFTIKDYHLRFYKASGKQYVWVCNDDGEGMAFTIDALYDLIDGFFKENF